MDAKRPGRKQKGSKKEALGSRKEAKREQKGSKRACRKVRERLEWSVPLIGKASGGDKPKEANQNGHRH